jgi:uncharacterized protein (UPF0332 family)
MNPHLTKAREALQSATLLMEAGDLAGAANRAYYAAFHAARAVVAKVCNVKPKDIKTHHGLRRLFELHVVKPNLIDREIARRFNDIETTRIAADYDDEPVQRKEIEAAIADAKSFLAKGS